MKIRMKHYFISLALLVVAQMAQASTVYLHSDNPNLKWKLKPQSEVGKDFQALFGTNYNTASWVDAVVPGTAFNSYVVAGLEKDPNFGDNIHKVDRSKYDRSFWYRTELKVPSDFTKELIWLNFNGVNRKAEVYLNGEILGTLDGFMHRGRFNVTEKNFFTYALFVSFFPQLVAGPIERAKNLLPQFYRKHKFNTEYATEGLRLILWGYFMKVVVADRLSIYVDAAYNNAVHHSGVTLIVATLFFAFQIYCDFGGYSFIAIGCAKIMGFDLMMNFRRPYLSSGTIDFWRRWHISLSTWFRDYVYIPLGGNRCSRSRNYLNLMITFLLSGLWHGANWTFIIWGGLNGLFQVIEKIVKTSRKKITEKENHLRKYISIILTFILICFSWIFFRANTVSDSFLIIKKIFSFEGPLFTRNIESLIYGGILIAILTISDILQERNNGKNYFLDNKNKYVRYFSYLFVVIMILSIGVFDTSQFIYFQF